MIANIALLALLFVPATGAPRPAHRFDRPRVELWTNHGNAVYTRGQKARVYVRADRDAYITIFRVDTDGRVRVLFPHDPWEDNFARGGREYEIQGPGGRDAFHVQDYPGVGYVFAVASADPFSFDPILTAGHWDYRVIADGRVRGDPYVALTDIAVQILPPDYADWDYDIVPYYVERHYDYPRFLCYDCHSYASRVYWNPYYYSCTSFRIVIYDDPWYYPYRYYRGTRVVFVRPYRPEPRFIFKDRRPTDAFVVRGRERPVNDRGVRGRDIGIVVPPPRDRDRPNRPDDRDDGRDRPDRPERPDRPDRPDRSDRPDGRPDHSNRPEYQRRAERSEPRPQGREARGERTEVRRGEPRRSEPRAVPQRARPPEPRAASRKEGKRDAPKSAPERRDPELKRRKP